MSFPGAKTSGPTHHQLFPPANTMKVVLAFLGVAVVLVSATSIDVVDPLECSQEEYSEALRMVPRGMSIFYKPLLTNKFTDLRNILTDENSVRWHMDCILYDKTCTSLGKAMQCE